MSKIYKTLRNNWKKSILFTVVGAYGTNYGIERYEEQSLMRSYCKEALAYGEQTQSLASKPYHVTVILNPAAHGGKSRTKFENFCEPLLHLAGLKVKQTILNMQITNNILMIFYNNYIVFNIK